MNKHRVVKLIIYNLIFLAVLLSSTNLKADREPARSLKEMEQRSHLILDGEIININIVEVEKIPVPNAGPVVRTKYKALFKIDTLVRGGRDADLTPGCTVDLVYWSTMDPRYKGEPSLKLSVGEKFRMYAEATAKKESGRMTIFLHTTNEIRPEAYKGKCIADEADDPIPGASSPQSALLPEAQATPNLPASTLVQQAESKSQNATALSAESAPAPSGFPIVPGAIILAVIVGIVLYIFRRKSK